MQAFRVASQLAVSSELRSCDQKEPACAHLEEGKFRQRVQV